MAVPRSEDPGRRRGQIEQRGDSWRVKVYAGDDPVTGKRVYLNETVQGTYRQADRRRMALVAEVDRQRATKSRATLSHVLDEWLFDKFLSLLGIALAVSGAARKEDLLSFSAGLAITCISDYEPSRVSCRSVVGGVTGWRAGW